MKQNNRRSDRNEQKKDALEESTISVNRNCKATKGGRAFSFQAVIVVGDRKGKIGLGSGKAGEVAEAIKKAKEDAVRNAVTLNFETVDGHKQLYHEDTGVCGGARVLVRPAKPGTGLRAGGAIRTILELAGVTNVTTKSLGSKQAFNVAQATLIALSNQKNVKEFVSLREGK